MRQHALSESNFDLWMLLGRANHAKMLVRQKELKQHHGDPVRKNQFTLKFNGGHHSKNYFHYCNYGALIIEFREQNKGKVHSYEGDLEVDQQA